MGERTQTFIKHKDGKWSMIHMQWGYGENIAKSMFCRDIKFNTPFADEELKNRLYLFNLCWKNDNWKEILKHKDQYKLFKITQNKATPTKLYQQLINNGDELYFSSLEDYGILPSLYETDNDHGYLLIDETTKKYCCYTNEGFDDWKFHRNVLSFKQYCYTFHPTKKDLTNWLKSQRNNPSSWYCNYTDEQIADEVNTLNCEDNYKVNTFLLSLFKGYKVMSKEECNDFIGEELSAVIDSQDMIENPVLYRR